MSVAKFLKCSCSACGGHIEYPPEAIDTTISCPHCGRETVLSVDVPAFESPAARRHTWVLWALAAFVILGALGASAPALLKRALNRKRGATGQNPPAAPPRPASPAPAAVIKEFAIGPAQIDRSGGASLVYAIGTLTNTLPKQRFAVRVEIELLDAAGKSIGSASDYVSVIEPNAAWRFKALVVKGNAVAARVAGIREQ